MDKAERTKRYIIEKTSPIFNKKGYHGTSLSDLTKATKLSKGSIYGNFSDKDDVAIQCFLFNVEKITGEISSQIEGVENSVEKLLIFPKVYKKIYNNIIENGGCPIANTLLEADDTLPELHHRAVGVIRRLESTLISIIEEGKADGEIAESTNSVKIARLMITLFEGGIILAKSANNEDYILNALEQVETIIESITK